METAGETGEEHSDRSTANVEADLIVGEGHHARCLHLVAEAGSIVLQVSNNMNEGKKDGEDGEEAGETTAAIETAEISKRRGNPKTHRGEEKYTQRRETALERSEQMHKNVSETKKIETTARHPNNSRRLQRCQKHPRNQICKEESARYKDKE